MSDNFYVILIHVQFNVFSFEICMFIESLDIESALLALHLVKSYFTNYLLCSNESLLTKLESLKFPYIIFCGQLFSSFFPNHSICYTYLNLLILLIMMILERYIGASTPRL